MAEWTIGVDSRLAKRVAKLPLRVQQSFAALMQEIAREGPIRGNWPNYSKLGGNRHHCHLKKGHPTYVAVWETKDRQIRFVEVVYVGTHEKAPY
jgi:hypothetical protein